MHTLRDQLQHTLGSAYSLEQELGGGGMSRVFVATDNALGRRVVVKVLPPEMSGQVSINRFKQEISIAARLQHAHVVPLLSAGDVDGLPYFIMPLVDGETLRERLVRQGELPINDAVRLLREVASALSYAHAHQVVHRDIKPENVLLSGGAAMVTDFGVAKALSASTSHDGTGLTSAGVALGTPAYMAPEQASADPHVDHRADIYAWGVMAYELLTGHAPFAGRPPAALLAAHMTEVPEHVTTRRANVPGSLATLVMRALEKVPADRPQSADDLVRALDAAVTPTAGLGPAASRSSLRPSLRPVTTMLRTGVAAVILVAVAWFAYAQTKQRGAANSIRRLVVVPVVMADRDSMQQPVADGLAQDLHTELSRIAALTVINTWSAMQLKAKSIDPRDVGRKLDVDHVVIVSVRAAGSGIHVSVDVADAQSSGTTWSSSFDSPLSDIDLLPERIARVMSDELHLQSPVAGLTRERHRPPPAAYALYNQGRFFHNLGTRPDLERALECFRQAIALDGRYADAYAAAATTWEWLADVYIAPSVAYPHADTLAQQALALDSLNVEARTAHALARISLYWDWPGAKRELDRALDLDANNANVHFVYSIYWTAQQDAARAINESRVGMRLDPANIVNVAFLGWFHLWAEHFDSAAATNRQVERLDPTFGYGESLAAELFRRNGLRDSALARDQKLSSVLGRPTGGLVVSLVALGQRSRAEAAYRELEHLRNTSYVAAEYLARAALALGHREQSLAWLAQGVREHSAVAAVVQIYPDMAAMMRDTDYLRIRAQMGLTR